MRRAVVGTLAAAALACGGSAPAPNPEGAQAAPPPESEAPVALNPDVPIAYPPALFEQKVEGDVVLRLLVDSTGRLIAESTRVAEPSGYPALDSAALAGSARLRFAPAKRHGVPVATAFLQPVEFRHPGTTGSAGRGGTVAAPAPPPRVPAATPQPAAPRPPAPALPIRAQPDTARRRPDTTRTPTDTARPRPDTARPPADTARPPPPTDAAAH